MTHKEGDKSITIKCIHGNVMIESTEFLPHVQEAQDSKLDKVDAYPNKMFSLFPIVPPGKSKDSSLD
jgi:hypothetical protein